MEVFEQFKAEVDGAELTAAKKLALQQKYGLAAQTEEESELWHGIFIGVEVSHG